MLLLLTLVSSYVVTSAYMTSHQTHKLYSNHKTTRPLARVVTQVQQQMCMLLCSRCMLHCPHASDRGTRPSDLVSGTCNTKRLVRAGRRKRRIVEVDGHAQARSRRRPRCFLTCQSSAHRGDERGDMRMSLGRAVYLGGEIVETSMVSGMVSYVGSSVSGSAANVISKLARAQGG